MATRSEITQILIERPACRERRNRKKVIGGFLQRYYPHELGEMSLSRLEDIIGDSITMDRTIRDIQQPEENKHLRGTDWEDGEALSQEYQIKKLSKEVGFSKDIKKKRLSPHY